MLELSVIYQLEKQINHSLLSILRASWQLEPSSLEAAMKILQKHLGLLFQLAVQAEGFKYAKPLILTYSLLEFLRSLLKNGQTSRLVNGKH